MTLPIGLVGGEAGHVAWHNELHNLRNIKDTPKFSVRERLPGGWVEGDDVTDAILEAIADAAAVRVFGSTAVFGDDSVFASGSAPVVDLDFNHGVVSDVLPMEAYLWVVGHGTILEAANDTIDFFTG